MVETAITFRGQTYRLGQPGTPLSLETIAPATLPKDWQEIDGRQWCREREYGRAYQSQTGFLVLVSASLHERKRWLHVSVTHRGGRFPTWDEMCQIKNLFCGEDRTAYQIHPPKGRNVSIHAKCLHLWAPLDGPVTPDFTGGGETI